jgi:Bacterial membrane protein YfhO
MSGTATALGRAGRRASPSRQEQLSHAVTRVVRHRDFIAVVLVVLAVVVANGLYLLGVFDPNPLNLDSGLGLVTKGGLLPGVPYIDPNSGITAQALGHLAVLDWLHGHLPWWNPFEGIGTPLAGAMQAAALFPLTLLLALSTGQLYFHMVLEATAGLATYFLLRRLVSSRAAAAVGGVAFALNGTFAWFAHAAVNPVAFLPLCLLGVERAREGAADGRIRRWWILALALALSVYAGFPEVAYVDGLLVIVWALVRLVGLRAPDLRRFVASTALGGVAGLMLCAPLAVAFADYVPATDLGPHATVIGNAFFQGPFAPPMVAPYIYGPIFGFQAFDHTGTLADVWRSVGGYLTASLIVLALIGLTGRRHRPLRLTLALWIAVALGRTFGAPVLWGFVDLLPEMKKVAFYRYAPPSWELAVIVLAMLGLDDVLRGAVSHWRVLTGLVGGAGAIAMAGFGAWPLVSRLVGAPGHLEWFAASLAWSAATVVLIALAIVVLRGRARLVVLCSVVVVDVLAMFVTPELSAPRSASVDVGAVTFLQRHLGDYRFFTIGSIHPDYGSYWQIASADINDAVIPKLYATYIKTHLNTNVDPLTFSGGNQLSPSGPSPLQEFDDHMSAYEKVGVKYLVMPPGTAAPTPVWSAPLPRVYANRTASIYQLPHPVPMFESTAGSACRVLHETIDSASVSCRAPATLVRDELYMPGWSATVNGRSVPVDKSDDLVESVRLPEGTSVVQFSFVPPHMGLALWVFVLGLLCLLGPAGLRAGRRLRRDVGMKRLDPSDNPPA